MPEKEKRRGIYIRSDHHSVIKELHRESRREMQAIIDDIIESGLKVKRLVPREQDTVEA